MYSPCQPLLYNAVSFLHGLYQTTGIDNVHQILRKRSDREDLPVFLDGLAHGDGDGIALFDHILNLAVLNEKQAVVDGIAEENAGVRFGDDTFDLQRLDDLRRLLSGRTAAKILSGDDDVAL